MNFTNQVHAAEQIEDPVERLLSLELIRQQLYAGDTYKTNEAQRLLGRSELPAEHWGPLTLAIARAEKALRLPPKRSDWVKRSQVRNSEPNRLLQDSRPMLYTDAKFWDKESRAWDELAHKASIQESPSLREADKKQKKAQAEKAAATPVRYSEWH